jgi:hypothetical protein
VVQIFFFIKSNKKKMSATNSPIQAIQALSEWRQNRKATITTLKSLIDKLNKLKRNVDISKLVGSSVAILGASMAAVGVVLAPATLCGALALSATGSTLALTGSLTSSGASLVNFAVSKADLKKARNLLEKDKQLLLHLQNIFQDKELFQEVTRFIASAGSGVKNFVDVIKLTYDIANEADGIAMLSVNFVSKVVVNLPKMVTNATIVLNIFGTILSVYDLVETSISVSKGSRSEYAQKLANIVTQMEEEEKEEDLQNLLSNNKTRLKSIFKSSLMLTKFRKSRTVKI